MLGIRSQARWLGFLPRHLPVALLLPAQQSGYNKRLASITWALANPKFDERQVLMAILDHAPSWPTGPAC